MLYLLKRKFNVFNVFIQFQTHVRERAWTPLSPPTVKAIFLPPRFIHLATAIPLDSPPPAAGGWGIVGSTCVYSVWCGGLAAGGVVEAVARPESLLWVAVVSSVSGVPVELCDGSAVLLACAARRSCGCRFPLPEHVVAALVVEVPDRDDGDGQASVV
jgi:hypothetical protein